MNLDRSLKEEEEQDAIFAETIIRKGRRCL